MAWKQLEMEPGGTTGKQVGNTAAAGCQLPVPTRFPHPRSLPSFSPLSPLPWRHCTLVLQTSFPLSPGHSVQDLNPPSCLSLPPDSFPLGAQKSSYFFHSSGPLAPQNKGHLDPPKLPLPGTSLPSGFNPISGTIHPPSPSFLSHSWNPSTFTTQVA